MSRPRRVVVIDRQKPKPVSEFDLPTNWDLINSELLLSPDGSLLVAGSSTGGTLYVFDTTTGQGRYSITDSACLPVFSSDGRWLATARRVDATGPGQTASVVVRIHDAATGQSVRDISGDMPVAGLCFSPNGEALAAAADVKNRPHRERLQLSKTVVFDTRSGQPLRTLAGGCDCVLFTPDGKRMITGSAELGVTKVWDAESGQLLLSLRATGAGRFTRLAVSPNGAYLAAMDDTPLLHRVILWDASALKSS
jgi:WD40 repeat protein